MINTSKLDIYCALLLEGIGMGGVVASNMIALQASVRHEDIGKCKHFYGRTC